MSLSDILSQLKLDYKSSVNIVDITKKNDMVFRNKSLIVKDQNGLFASRDINTGEKVVIYFGDILTKEEFLKRYNNDKSIMNYIRKGKTFWIDGSEVYKIKNKNLYGGYVNDISRPKNTSKKAVNKYIKSMNKCNLVSIPTGDFPIYIARKNIKAGEELTVHYGLGYWLLFMGVSTRDIAKKFGKLINNTYN